MRSNYGAMFGSHRAAAANAPGSVRIEIRVIHQPRENDVDVVVATTVTTVRPVPSTR
jgi:hypothetical protein